MRAVEASAKTREEAIQNALDELGVEMHDVDNIEILDEGSRGLFGLGSRPVRVRVVVEDMTEETPSRPKHGDKKGGAPSERGANRREASRNRNERGGKRGERGGRNRKKGAAQDRPITEDKERAAKKPRTGNRDAGPSTRQRDNRQAADDKRTAPAEKASAPKKEKKPRREDELEAITPSEITGDVSGEPEASARGAAEEAAVASISETQGKEAAALLQEVIGKMGMQATVEFARASDDTARLNVQSEDGAILIGRKGRNLSAMQYLINRIISRADTAESTERLVVDVEGYVDRRRSTLEAMARDLARKAKSTRRNMRLKPMTPQERRIIHITLQDDPDVRTFSHGESLYRSVVISPKNAPPERERSYGGRRGGRNRPSQRSGHEADVDAGQFGD